MGMGKNDWMGLKWVVSWSERRGEEEGKGELRGVG